MPPSTIITPKWNSKEVYRAIPTQDPEVVRAEKHRVVEQLHQLGHIRALVEVKDLHAWEADLTEEQIREMNQSSFFSEFPS